MNRLRSLSAFSLAALALLGASGALADEVRVATLLPAVENALQGVPNVRVVASIRASMRAPERTDVVDLGSPHSPNLERLASANADLVVADALINAPMKEELARSGAEVMLLDTSSVDATFAGLLELGKKVGAPDVLAERVKASRAKLAQEALGSPVKVLALFGTPGTFQVVTQGAWIGSLLETLRFENLGAGLTGASRFPGFAEVSHEKLATLRPDLVLLIAHGDPTRIRQELDTLMSGSGPWRGLGKASRGVHVLPPDLFVSNPGLELPRAGQVIAELGAPAPAVGSGKAP
jgi:iron complex transport system substrate-binding protein